MGNRHTRNAVSVSRRESGQSFILLKPRRVRDSEGMAKAIARCKGVKEVCMTSGNYAFVVSTSQGCEKDINVLRSKIQSVAGTDAVVCVALNHYVYRQNR